MKCSKKNICYITVDKIFSKYKIKVFKIWHPSSKLKQFDLQNIFKKHFSQGKIENSMYLIKALYPGYSLKKIHFLNSIKFKQTN